MAVDGGGEQRDDHRRGTTQMIHHFEAFHGGRRIDDDPSRLGRHPLSEGAGHTTRCRLAGEYAMDARQVIGSQLQPLPARALGIVVDQGRRGTRRSVVARQIGRDGCLPTASLAVED